MQWIYKERSVASEKNKDYLREKHPDWAESSLSTHVSDAFYLYQNTIALSFWEMFLSDESMAAAKQDILEYLKHDVMSERAENARPVISMISRCSKSSWTPKAV